MHRKEISYDSVKSAFNKLKERATIIPYSESVHILNAYKRVLADDVVSKFGVPQYNSSHMDGFAVRYNDIKNTSNSNPVTLRIYDIQLSTKDLVNFVLPKSHAYRISTGMSLPKGSDTVIPIENSKIVREGNYEKIEIQSSIQYGSFVFPASKDIKKGEKILLKGTVLRAQDIGLLTFMRIFQVPVFKKPIVAIIPTGNELSDNLATRSDKIPNIHSHIISWLVEEIGGTSLDFGVTPDNLPIILNKIKSAITKADLILTIGGSSVGKYDLVKEAIRSRDVGGMIALRTKLDRGRVTGLATLDGKPIIILPGPIQGAINAFIVFAHPLLRLMSGRSEKRSELTIYATMIDDWEARRKFLYFTKIVYVKLVKIRARNEFVARPLIGETESMTLLTKCDGYIIVPQHITNMRKGQIVEVNLMPGFSY
ncbi:MAG TPA: molybdopterin molybdotransferase MoeA [Nitrososphaeraceae archaeon]|jgi:molybdenum cofactor synthesis domain-containing protein